MRTAIDFYYFEDSPKEILLLRCHGM